MVIPGDVWHWLDLAVGAGLGWLGKILHGWLQKKAQPPA